MVYPPYCCVLAEYCLPSQPRQLVHVLPAGDSAQMCKRLAQMGIEAERLIHPFIAGGAGDGQAGKGVFLAPFLRRLCQQPGSALFPEHRLNVKVIEYPDICAGEGGKAPGNAAHPHCPIASPCRKERDLPIPDGLRQLFLLFLR